MAVLPTPGVPDKDGVVLGATGEYLYGGLHLLARPMTGSSLPSLAIWVRSRLYSSRVGVALAGSRPRRPCPPRARPPHAAWCARARSARAACPPPPRRRRRARAARARVLCKRSQEPGPPGRQPEAPVWRPGPTREIRPCVFPFRSPPQAGRGSGRGRRRSHRAPGAPPRPPARRGAGALCSDPCFPHSAACRAARCSSSSVESEKSCVMSTCSALRSGTTLLRPAPLRPAPPDAPSSKNLLKKSSKRLPPPRGDPPRRERPPLASAACTSHKCSSLGSSAGTMRLMVTVAGLTPHTSHILVAIFDPLLSLNVL
jgi:hypothetical protein